MDGRQVDAYLARIGAARPSRPDPGSLPELQLRHLLTVPFENLSIHLGEPIVLEGEALLDKLVGRRRGGFCYELNGAFAALLSALGYRVTLLAARVHGAAGLGPPFDHLALRVEAPDPWLVDVGFGSFSHHPLRLGVRDEQADPAGTFRVTESGDGDLDVHRDGQPQYRIEQRPRVLPDFGPTCWWQQTSPESHFTRGPVCSLLTADGRVTLSDRTLVRTVAGRGAQFVLVGSGTSPAINEEFWRLKWQLNDHPDCHLELGWDPELAHQVYAGSDLVVMPSMYEPCGLTQLIAAKYATVPIVRAIGGLCDTVFDHDHAGRPPHDRNGYVFHQVDSVALESAMARAIGLWHAYPWQFRQLMENGMRADYSWAPAGHHYLNVYDHIRHK